MAENVSLVIVSHSPDVAKGTQDMVEQMVGKEVRVASCGGDPDGGLGTNMPVILEKIKEVFSPRGTVILVDLGGAETNSEMAIEQLPPAMRDLVLICEAPLVEGAIMAATESSTGADLATVRKTAEDF